MTRRKVLPTRDVRWFFPRTKLGWAAVGLVFAPVAVFVYALSVETGLAAGIWGVLAGCTYVAVGMSFRYGRLRGRRWVKMSALEMATLQDARGRGAALVGMAVLIGSLAGMLLAVAFP